MLVEILQGPASLPEPGHLAYIAIGILGTVLGAILASPLIVKIYESHKAKEKTKKTDGQAIELSKDQELYKIREELRQEVEALRQVLDVIASEKLNLTQQIFLLNIRIKEQEVHEMELDEEVLLKASENEALRRENGRLKDEARTRAWRSSPDDLGVS